MEWNFELTTQQARELYARAARMNKTGSRLLKALGALVLGMALWIAAQAGQALLPGLWDGATPTLLERDGRLYIRCADPCSGSQWMQQLSADAKSYTVVTQGAPGQGQGGQGHGQGGQGYGQGGLRQRLRDNRLCLAGEPRYNQHAHQQDGSHAAAPHDGTTQAAAAVPQADAL